MGTHASSALVVRSATIGTQLWASAELVEH